MFVVAGRCWCSQRSSRFCIRLAFDSQHDGWFSSIQMFPCCFPAAEPSVSLSGRRARVSRPLRSGEPASALGVSARSSATSCLAERVKLTFTQKLSERQFVNIWLLWCSAQGDTTLSACPEAKNRGSRRFTEPELWHTRVLLSLLTAWGVRVGFWTDVWTEGEVWRRHFGLWDAVTSSFHKSCSTKWLLGN